ncbi:hypothetical protein L3X38_027842 [Prunus dulcis]|uniref:Retrovirus-related Pol polyprotein from transposon TNT 1-94-like beta-barrel domain-containing protein n=1 Tax=Prunus dulcis TaxID=3755 RepID=A0AAD4VNP0_PRUDU|nr:hypothetical protein L3X38_027842 [Prunus dulcis]
MKCADDIKTFQDAVLADRVYEFLAGLDDTYDKVRIDILRSDKVPSIENVFFMVHREAQLQITMLGSGTKIGESTIAFASKNTALVSRPPGFGSSTASPSYCPPPPTLTAISSTPTPQPTGNFGKTFHAHDTRNTGWIIDSGATDHIMYNSALFSTTLPPHRDHVLTARNAVAPVTGASSILLTPATPSLDKVLLVPSLSSNLLSVPQVTEQLNCVVLMYPSFVLLQDIQTREIFGRGTKNGGLYYVDDVATSRVLHAGSAETSQHLRNWLLHCLFGHASFGYL